MTLRGIISGRPLPVLSPVGVSGFVRCIVTERGLVVSDETYPNTQCNWGLYACAAWYSGTAANVSSSVGAVVPPGYIAVGTGTSADTPTVTDTNMFNEQYGSRRAFTFRTVYNGYTAQMSLSYLATDPDGTYTEAGLWDQLPVTVNLSGAVVQGATSLPLASGAPAVNGGTTPGQFTTIYVDDGANSEYVAIAVPASAGAASWSLQSGLQYGHASGTPVVAFVGNLFAHSAINVTKGYGQQLTVQWSIPFQAGTPS